MLNAAKTLTGLGRYTEAVAACDEMLARFGASVAPTLQESLGKTLVVKASCIVALGGRGEEEIAIYDDLLTRFGNSTELVLREQAAWAMYNKGFRLAEWGRRSEARTALDDLLARFDASESADIAETITRARVARKMATAAQ